MTKDVVTYISIGSNLNEPVNQVESALLALAQLPNTRILAVSSLYETIPVGPSNQPNFINAVTKLKTQIPALQLLHMLQAIEHRQGRTRTVRWGPRTIDLDILLYGAQSEQSAQLTLPHPEMLARDFVLVPLREIEPTLVLPNGKSIDQQLGAIDTSGIVRKMDLVK